ncbi:MAG: amidase family protein, partial [Terriglobales bacterium]
GGSVRAPAALCGLAGYRATLGRGDWRGGAHLAQSFDTMGWLFTDLRDAPLLTAPFARGEAIVQAPITRFAAVDESFLEGCEPQILACFRGAMEEIRAQGLKDATVDASWWHEALEIYAPIQAWEAARIHAGHFAHFEDAIRERLEWGARISDAEIAALRQRHREFRTRMDALLREHEILLLPATPVARLAAGADHSQTRRRLLRYTTPFSLAGVPVVTAPFPSRGQAGGVQMAAAHGRDEDLLALAARIGAQRMLTDSSRNAC